MLGSADIATFFSSLRRDFELIINDKVFKCNKQSLSSFSTKIRNESPGQILRLSIEVREEAISDVLEFCHGKFFEPNNELLFDYYYFAAFMGIHGLSDRLVFDVCNSFDESNITERCELLSPFPEFCKPLIIYLSRHPETFSKIINSSKFSSDFIKTLIDNSTDLFQTEDEKYLFIKKFNEEREPDESLYETVRLDKLSPSLMDEAIACDRCKSFGLLRSLHDETASLDAKAATVEMKIEKVKAEERRLGALESPLSTKINETIRKLTEISDRIDMCASCISLLPVIDNTTQQYMDQMAMLSSKSKELHSLISKWHDSSLLPMPAFADKWFSGKSLYPETCVQTFEMVKNWMHCVDSLDVLTKKFQIDQIQTEELATRLAAVAQSLREVIQELK